MKENKQFNSEEIYKTLLNLSLDGIYIENERGEILDCNFSGHNMFGYTKEEMLKLSVRDLVPKEFAESIPEIIPDEMATGDRYIERVNVKKNGQIFPTEINSKYIIVEGERRLIVYVRDISERKELENKLREMSQTDELTKIHNRRYMMKMLEEYISIYKSKKESFSVSLLDIDDFKRINDNYGHTFGDEVLLKFSNIVKGNLRKADYFGRVGGEEFLLIFPEISSCEGESVLMRIRENLKSEFLETMDLSVTFSAGLLEINQHKEEYICKDVINIIDKLMYQAKHSGKDCIVSC